LAREDANFAAIKTFQHLQRGAHQSGCVEFGVNNVCGAHRLKALGLDLPEGFGLPELEQALAAADRPGAEAPATSLEVLGGPEDGRLFTMQPGEWLGRDIPGLTPDHALYTDTPMTDPRLPRRAVEWLGPGRLSLPRAVTRPDGDVVGPGVIELWDGEVLQLTRATTVRGVAEG
jgi:hypothetical protein